MKNGRKSVKVKKSTLPRLNLINISPISLSGSQNIDINEYIASKSQSARVEQKPKKITVGSQPPQTTRVSKIKYINHTNKVKDRNAQFFKDLAKLHTEEEQFDFCKNTFNDIVAAFPKQEKSLLAVKNGYESEIQRLQEQVDSLMDQHKAYTTSEKGFNTDILALESKISSKRKELEDRVATIIEQTELTRQDIDTLNKHIAQVKKENSELYLQSESSVHFLQELNLDIEASQKEYDKLKHQFDNNSQKIADTKEEIEQSYKVIDTNLMSIYSTQQYINSHNKEISAYNERIQASEEKLEKLRSMIEQQKEIERQKQSEVDEIVNKIEDINKYTDKLKEDLIFLNDASDVSKLPDEPFQLLQFYLNCFAKKKY